MKPGRIVALVFGCLAALIGIGLTASTVVLGAVYGTQRDGDGFFGTGRVPMHSTTAALRSDDIDLGNDENPDRWPFGDGDLATVRLRVDASEEQPIFVGIAHSDDVDAYLEGVSHDEVDDVQWRSDRVTYRRVAGERASLPVPAEQAFWVASAEGSGRQVVTWDVQGGNWSIVLMNADGSRNVTADVAIGVKISLLPWLILGLGIGALVTLGIATGLIIWATRPAGRTTPVDQAAVTGPPAVRSVAVTSSSSPVSLNARLDEPLSRGLWLVKWFLAIPHFIVLAFLWIAFFVTTFIAWWAILFTARYPRSLFTFNVGVMRWSWRVGYYATSAIGTDKYPPFSLRPDDDYPATLDVEYPERLSRGLIFVKWWLLAIPHYIVVGLFVGGGWFAGDRDSGWAAAGGPGLVGWLTLFAGVALLFTGRYPRRLSDFLLGMIRWCFRVGAYATLMTDRYPPFALDQGPSEPADPTSVALLDDGTGWPPPPPAV